MSRRPQIALLLAAVVAGSACAQTAPKDSPPLTTQFNRNLVFLDPAHGGGDVGAHLTSQLLEKDITLALALKLRNALSARGFTVVMARQMDDPNSPSLDDRAGAANHLRPVACLLIHATAASRGVHLYASSLAAPQTEPRVLPWDSAQAAWVPQSLRLASEIGTSLARGHTPVLIHRADPKPLDSLTCPAIALELAPLAGDGDSTTPVNDGGYQQRVADAVANALVFWKNHADPQLPSSGVAPTNNSAPVEGSPMEQPRPIQPLPPLAKPLPQTTPQRAPKPVAPPASRSPQPARRTAPESSSLAMRLTASMEGHP